MATVVPTVLAVTSEEFSTKLQLAESLSPRVHIDICDGQFADNRTINLAQVHASEATRLDLHLMLQNPLSELENALSHKPELIIFHAESNGDLKTAFEHVRQMGVKAGLALLPSTQPESVRELIMMADHVLIFTGTLSHNARQFNVTQLEKVAQIRQIKPELELSVDGGVQGENAALISLQGIDVLYVGSYLQSAEDPKTAFAALAHQAGGVS